MRKIFFIIIGVLLLNIAFSQTTYNFIGNGNWTVASNWSNNTIPPTTLPAGSVININLLSGDSCILSTQQTISSGATLNVYPTANFIIYGNLNVVGFITYSG